MKKVWDDCKEISDPKMPFANGGCFEQIQDQLSESLDGVIEIFKGDMNRTNEKLDQIMEVVKNASQTLQEKCFEFIKDEKNQTCREYFKEELHGADVKRVNNGEGTFNRADGPKGLNGLSIAFEWSKMKDVMGEMMDEKFWLNAPDDCGIKNPKEAVEAAVGMKQEFQAINAFEQIRESGFLQQRGDFRNPNKLLGIDGH